METDKIISIKYWIVNAMMRSVYFKDKHFSYITGSHWENILQKSLLVAVLRDWDFVVLKKE